jgi:hypothetical protein
LPQKVIISYLISKLNYHNFRKLNLQAKRRLEIKFPIYNIRDEKHVKMYLEPDEANYTNYLNPELRNYLSQNEEVFDNNSVYEPNF